LGAADDVAYGPGSTEAADLGASAAKKKTKTFFELDSFKMTSSPVATAKQPGQKVRKPLEEAVEELISLNEDEGAGVEGLLDETSGKTVTMKVGDPTKIPGARMGFFEGFPSATCSSATKTSNIAKWPLSTHKQRLGSGGTVAR